MRAREILRNCGPGLVVAATGLGAGDIVAAAVAGAQFGPVLMWAVLVGGLLKFCLNEGIGRWQLVTGTTLIEGWITHLPRFVSGYFFCYLLLWSFMVAAAMMAACGLAAYALFPALSVTTWGILHGLVGLVIVLTGAWQMLETLMKFFIALMFVTIMYCAIRVLPQSPALLLVALQPGLPSGSLGSVLSIMGGVGGSVTLLSYGYWMQEAGWKGKERISMMRWDLGVAYGLTVLFAVAIMLVAAGIKPSIVTGNGMALALANELVSYAGQGGKWLFLFGFWGAVFSSLIGVWHGVPYMFTNFVAHYRDHRTVLASQTSITRSGYYRGYLVLMCLLPITLLVFGRPVWIVQLYAITGSLFMPLLAALLLVLNGSQRWMQGWRNSPWVSACLVFCLLLFGYLLVTQPFAGG